MIDNNKNDKDAYAELGKYYDNLIGKNYYKRLEILFENFTSGFSHNAKHLDIGCGTGFLIRKSKDMNLKPVGIDISDQMVKLAKKNNPDIKILKRNFLDIKSSFDIITANNDVLNHLKSSFGLNVTLKNIDNILNENGIFFSDAVSSYDILKNWEKCDQILTDDISFKCKITHKVTNFFLPQGEMTREWSFIRDGIWIMKCVEVENVIGISSEELISASEKFNFKCYLFNWYNDECIDVDTARIGILLKKTGLLI